MASHSKDLPQISLLVEQHIAHFEKLLVVDLKELENLQLDSHSKIKDEDLVCESGIDLSLSKEIIGDLISANVIDSNGELLATKVETELAKLEHSCFAYLTEDVQNYIINIVTQKCSYQFQKLQILEEVKMDSKICISVSINRTAFSHFLQDCYRLHLIKGVSVNPEKVKGNSIFPEDIKNSFADKIKSFLGPYNLDKKKLKTIFPCSTLEHCNKIQEILLAHQITNENHTIIRDLKDFPATSENDVSHQVLLRIKLYLEILDKFEDSKFRKNLTSHLHVLRGSINVDRSAYYLEALSSKHIIKLDTTAELLQEKRRLEDIGLDLVITTTFSDKLLAICIFVIGTGEIFGGAIMSAVSFGTLGAVGVPIITSGIQDIVIGIRLYKTGVFCWEDWIYTKFKYVIFTSAFLGIGKLISALSIGKSIAQNSVRAAIHTRNFAYTVSVKHAGEAILRLIMDEAFCSAADAWVKSLIKGFTEKLLAQLIADVTERLEKEEQLTDLFLLAAQKQKLEKARATVKHASTSALKCLTQGSVDMLEAFKKLKPLIRFGVGLAFEKLPNLILGTKTSELEQSSITSLLNLILGRILDYSEYKFKYGRVKQTTNKYFEKLNLELTKKLESKKSKPDKETDLKRVKSNQKELRKICLEDFKQTIREFWDTEIECTLIKTAVDMINEVLKKEQKDVQQKLTDGQARCKTLQDTQTSLVLAESEIHKRRIKEFQKNRTQSV